MTVTHMCLHTMTLNAAAALFELPLRQISHADVTPADLTDADLARLTPEQLRKHVAAQLLTTHLDGATRTDLVVAFTRADFRCARSVFADPATDRADNQLQLIA